MVIPRLVHRIWLGGRVPDRFDQQWQSWREHHPRWDFVTWSDEDVAALSMPSCYGAAETQEERSDIARIAILDAVGGVYTDCDVTCHRSVTLLTTPGDVFVAFEEDYGVLWNGVLAAMPGAPVTRRALSLIGDRCARLQGEPPNVKTGPAFLTLVYRLQLFANPAGMRVYPPGFLATDGQIREQTWVSTEIHRGRRWTNSASARPDRRDRLMPRLRLALRTGVLHHRMNRSGGSALLRLNDVEYGEDA